MRRLLLALVMVFACFACTVQAIDPVDELQAEIDELEKLKKMSQDATAPLEAEVKNLVKRINNAQAQVKNIKVQIAQLEESIAERSGDLEEKTQALEAVVARTYKAGQRGLASLAIMAPEQDRGLLQSLLQYQLAQKRNQQQITDLADQIQGYQQDQSTLESTRERLVALEGQLSEQMKFFEHEIASAKSYQQELTGKIAELSAQQKAIIDARSGGSITSVGDVPAADDQKASITWKNQAPGDSFAVFSFGAYTHRNGMSQYGAKARAQAGQSAEEILAAYYPGAHIQKDYDAMGEIDVQGYGRMSFEGQYLQSIYEVPASWPLEVLKAQAIAARTYAIRYTGNGSKSICTTEACQVYKNGKKGGDWERAVNDTRGWVLVDDDGNLVSTQYASTHGGYSNTGGWDTDGGGKDDWTTRAWEAKAESPWFYKAWWRSGYSSSGDTCGRDSPWLSQEEMSDILNAYLVRQNPGSADTSRIQPVTISRCQIGGSSGNPYSMSELRDYAQAAGGAVTRINAVTVAHGDNGQTSSVTFQTNRGQIQLSGSEFKQIFNLRAPGYLRIPQSSFASFNIEYKN